MLPRRILGRVAQIMAKSEPISSKCPGLELEKTGPNRLTLQQSQPTSTPFCDAPNDKKMTSDSIDEEFEERSIRLDSKNKQTAYCVTCIPGDFTFPQHPQLG